VDDDEKVKNQTEKNYLINTFAQVGWFDPFAGEETFTATFEEPVEITDLVYHKDRYI
jgi:hypothetical protein